MCDGCERVGSCHRQSPSTTGFEAHVGPEAGSGSGCRKRRLRGSPNEGIGDRRRSTSRSETELGCRCARPPTPTLPRRSLGAQGEVPGGGRQSSIASLADGFSYPALCAHRVPFVDCRAWLDCRCFLLHLYAALAEKERALISALTTPRARGEEEAGAQWQPREPRRGQSASGLIGPSADRGCRERLSDHRRSIAYVTFRPTWDLAEVLRTAAGEYRTARGGGGTRRRVAKICSGILRGCLR